MIRLCVFDMDGLLLDSERQVYLKNGMEVSKELGKEIDQYFLTTLMGGSWITYKNRIEEEYKQYFSIDDYWRLLWERIQYTIDNVAIPLRPGAKEILDFCKKEGIAIAIATSTLRENALKCLKNAGLYDYIDFIIAADQVKETKPNPEIFLKAIEHFDVPKNEAIIFEDGHNGAKAAINGNCRFIVVPDLAALMKEDLEKADLVAKDLFEAIAFIKEENERTTGV